MIQQPSEAHLNNTAASIIEDGKYQEAITSLSNSIMRFSGYGRCEPSSCSCESCDHEGAPLLSLDQWMACNEDNFKEDGTPYLYKNPIRIPIESNGNCCKKKHEIIAATMVFNLALSHHLHALEFVSTIDRDFHLQKAMILYQMAFDVQKKEHFGLNYVFVLAIVNNMSMIHQSQNKMKLANEGFRNMLSILIYLVDSGNNIQSSRLEGFQYNVSLSTSLKITAENAAGAA